MLYKLITKDNLNLTNLQPFFSCFFITCNGKFIHCWRIQTALFYDRPNSESSTTKPKTSKASWCINIVMPILFFFSLAFIRFIKGTKRIVTILFFDWFVTTKLLNHKLSFFFDTLIQLRKIFQSWFWLSISIRSFFQTTTKNFWFAIS